MLTIGRDNLHRRGCLLTVTCASDNFRCSISNRDCDTVLDLDNRRVTRFELEMVVGDRRRDAVIDGRNDGELLASFDTVQGELTRQNEDIGGKQRT